MTHILIPIKAIDELKTAFKAIPEGFLPNEIIENLCKRERILSKLELLIVYKWSGKKEGYKQALKDLL